MSSDGDAERAVEEVRAEHGLRGEVRRYEAGSVPVFAVGAEHVVKLFPVEESAFFEREHAALARIDGSLSIPTPRVVALGARGGWHYVVMTQLRGRALAEVWPQIGRDERVRLVRAVGERLPVPAGVRDLESLSRAWFDAPARGSGGPLVKWSDQ
jgi:hygromycin-B 7''-O-kinase